MKKERLINSLKLVISLWLFTIPIFESSASVDHAVSSLVGLKQEQIEVTGVVRDSSGVLANVNISLKGNERIATATDKNGRFVFLVP